ncbi:hypothetical protein [Micromonospora sp. CB01531]|uniref:hypothetical protein n=1 Tax=Micromonospora sp. CB01531 TaxID=1718947 RepID=UPI00093C77AE|nr:hypothetical protein [Micromonospora sp. CB01531]OKI41320.1 hypothetical protein A6A27_39300 [Micromonospora sp. CB01531]
MTSAYMWGELLGDDHRTGVELVHRDCEAPLSAHIMCANGHEVPLDQAAVRLKDEAYVTAMRNRSRGSR